ncbi:alpha-N-arabinofuranosidase [Lentilactobacillus fungorum]|uniref:non-reducing end alpha-L-arabinofuranosidase n=1 Tax=Lentilactobacillus fungorum TaxID=2201250 RepID=A0ABQ3VZU7_9LACO|nr:alpha-N-arabinofuranosidase [Lentilactobacillus fungorum]GHP13757.1 alpha-N-arabinofuranosidase [Lentilactobacillus fungorum]
MKSKLKISKALQIAPIDPRLWGSFVEQGGRAVYEGLYQPNHPTADSDGFRTDVIKAVKQLGVPLVRFPGGNYVSGYNWEDGIGPKQARPVRAELAWKSLDNNQFGLHEFMKWCVKVGTQPYLAINLGTRGIDEARRLVEYCNFPYQTALTDLRKQNGADKPFNVKLWALGNEVDGDWQIGHKTAYEYGRLAHETAKVIHTLDPDAELVACGSSMYSKDTFGKWENTVLDACYDDVDYLSIHQYFGNSDNDFAEFLGSSVKLEHFITDEIAICDSAKARKRSNKTLNIAFDEWNVWYHSSEADKKQKNWQYAPHLLEDHYNFEDALLIGSLAITLMKHADRVKIGCLAQLVNVIAPIMTNTTGTPSLWYQSIYFPFMQVAHYGKGIALTPETEVASYPSKNGDVSYTDSIAVYNPDAHEMVIFVVNKSKNPVDFSVEVKEFKLGKLKMATQFAGYDIKQTNENQSMKLTDLKTINVTEAGINATLSGRSWNVIRIEAR